MAKPKSVKLRMLIILRTLFKYSDEKHPIYIQEINAHLRPYGLDCNRRVLNDAVETLKEFGIDVSYATPQYAGKAWITEPLFSDKDIGCFVFALTTNPHIPKAQAAEMLEKIKPFVTVYQEPLLCNKVESPKEKEEDGLLWEVFSTIQEACVSNRKIQYTTDSLRYNKDQTGIATRQSTPVRFTPKCFYRVDNELYLVGFRSSSLLPQVINLKDITSVKIQNKPEHISEEQQAIPTSALLSEISIPQKNTILYQGPVIFRCRGGYLRSLFFRFGPPSNSIKKNRRSIVTYPIDDMTLTSKDLYWLSQIPGFGIRIIGPEPAVEAVTAYYERCRNELVNPVFPIAEQQVQA